MKALVTVVLVNAAEVLYKPRCWLAKQCLLFMPCSTSVLQHEGSSHSDALAVDGQMPHAIPATVSSSAACMLQNAGAERCEECAAAWPLQGPYS